MEREKGIADDKNAQPGEWEGGGHSDDIITFKSRKGSAGERKLAFLPPSQGQTKGLVAAWGIYIR